MTSTTREQPFDQAAAALRESQTRTYSVNDAPMCADGPCICDPRESDEVVERRRDWWGTILFFVICLGLLCFLGAWYFGRAHAAEFEIYAERSGAAMRTDEPNVRRYRDRNSEPFDTRENCEQAAAGERRFDRELGAGWSLRCRPLHVPAPRMVVR
jgi:hypothetical protein